MDTMALTQPFSTLLLEIKHTIAAGQTGTGRSVYLSPWQQKDAPESIRPIFINFSAQVAHVNQLQNLVDSKFEKKHRGVYGSPAGKQTVIFIDDLNMPKMRLTPEQDVIRGGQTARAAFAWNIRLELEAE